MKKMEPSYFPHKCGNGATPFRGYTATYIKNFLTGLSLMRQPLFLRGYINSDISVNGNFSNAFKETERFVYLFFRACSTIMKE